MHRHDQFMRQSNRSGRVWVRWVQQWQVCWVPRILPISAIPQFPTPCWSSRSDTWASLSSWHSPSDWLARTPQWHCARPCSAVRWAHPDVPRHRLWDRTPNLQSPPRCRCLCYVCPLRTKYRFSTLTWVPLLMLYALSIPIYIIRGLFEWLL